MSFLCVVNCLWWQMMGALFNLIRDHCQVAIHAYTRISTAIRLAQRCFDMQTAGVGDQTNDLSDHMMTGLHPEPWPPPTIHNSKVFKKQNSASHLTIWNQWLFGITWLIFITAVSAPRLTLSRCFWGSEVSESPKSSGFMIIKANLVPIQRLKT